MARRNLRSISVPIVLAAVTVPLSAALLVGWSVVLGRKIATQEEFAGDVSLLVVGAIAFVVIMVVLVLFSVFLAREILEVRKQDSFIDSVTHELKSPLASLKLCLETLGRPELDGERRDELRRMMLDDVERLTSFIDDVLQATRLAHGKNFLMNLSELNVRTFVGSIAEQAAQRYQLGPAAIQVDVPADLTITTDPAALELVVKNLVDNAVKYSNEPVEVTVVARGDDDGVVSIEVRDRGIGIPPDLLRRVFHRFYRVDSEDVRRRRGTGLGLFVVSALVRSLGGRVSAQSQGPGTGATIRIMLPDVSRVEEGAR